MNLDIDQDLIKKFCQKWEIKELVFFGSVIREDFNPSSDVDVLVSFEDTATWSLLDHVSMQRELSEIIGRDVDLVTRRSVEQSHNWLRKKQILENSEAYYAA